MRATWPAPSRPARAPGCRRIASCSSSASRPWMRAARPPGAGQTSRPRRPPPGRRPGRRMRPASPAPSSTWCRPGSCSNNVEQAAPAALASELAAGDRALADGQRSLALQAYELALRIAPKDERALAGQARARELAEQPMAAPAQAACRAGAGWRRHRRPRPRRAGSAGAFGEDRYAKAAGEGFAALGAGRLEEARAAFERARALRPNGSEAVDGLKRVDAAMRARGFGTQRTRAEDAEADERWDDALSAYGAILRADPVPGVCAAGARSRQGAPAAARRPAGAHRPPGPARRARGARAGGDPAAERPADQLPGARCCGCRWRACPRCCRSSSGPCA